MKGHRSGEQLVEALIKGLGITKGLKALDHEYDLHRRPTPQQ